MKTQKNKGPVQSVNVCSSQVVSLFIVRGGDVEEVITRHHLKLTGILEPVHRANLSGVVPRALTVWVVLNEVMTHCNCRDETRYNVRGYEKPGACICAYTVCIRMLQNSFC